METRIPSKSFSAAAVVFIILESVVVVSVADPAPFLPDTDPT